MTDQHPITPPRELLRRLREEAPRFRDGGVTCEEWIATQSARWGADQQLEACCRWVAWELRHKGQSLQWGEDLRAALAMPERLTVQEISGLPKHGENCIREDGDDKILLDGHFSRADLQQLADSIPRNSQPTPHHD